MKQNYFISAGEFSGDLLAAELVSEIRKLDPHLHPLGITGPALRKEGVQSLLDIQNLAVMGISDVLKRISQIRMIEQRILQQIDQMKPKFAILVDYPGFHLRIAEQLKMRGIPAVQYIAPKAWAWGSGRVKKIRRDYDLVLGMLPFEEEFYKSAGVNYTYVGSPVMDRMDAFLETQNHDRKIHSSVIGCFPGSRDSEVKAMLPLFLDLREQFSPDTKLVISVAENIGWKHVCELLPELKLGRRVQGSDPILSYFNEVYEYRDMWFVVGQSFEIMFQSSVALVTSGTATLECALIGAPQVVVYKTQGLTFAIAKALLKVKYASLPNLILDREVLKEFLQDFQMSKVLEEAKRILQNIDYRQKMLGDYLAMRAKLKSGAASTGAQLIVNRYKVH